MLRPRFHLSTLLCASFVIGLLMWANLTKVEHAGILPWRIAVSREFGWPMTAYGSFDEPPNDYLSGLNQNAIHALVNRKFHVTDYGVRWSPGGICVDVFVFMFAIALNFLILEKLANRPRS